MNYYEPWNDRNFTFARRDTWTGAEFEKAKHETAKLRLYSFRICVVLAILLGVLVWVD